MIFYSYLTLYCHDNRNDDLFDTFDGTESNNIFNDRPVETNKVQSQKLFNKPKTLINQEPEMKIIFGDSFSANVKQIIVDYYKYQYLNVQRKFKILKDKITHQNNSTTNQESFYDIVNEFHIPIYCFITSNQYILNNNNQQKEIVDLEVLSIQDQKADKDLQDKLDDLNHIDIFLAPYIITDILEIRFQINATKIINRTYGESINFKFSLLDIFYLEYNFLIDLYENSEYLLYPAFFFINRQFEEEALEKLEHVRHGLVMYFKLLSWNQCNIYAGVQGKYPLFIFFQKNLYYELEIEISRITITYFYSDYFNFFYMWPVLCISWKAITVDLVISNVILWLFKIQKFDFLKIKICYYSKSLGLAIEIEFTGITLMVIYLQNQGFFIGFKFNNFYLDDCIRSNININNNLSENSIVSDMNKNYKNIDYKLQN